MERWLLKATNMPMQRIPYMDINNFDVFAFKLEEVVRFSHRVQQG